MLCECRINVKVKRRVNKPVVRQAVMYGAEGESAEEKVGCSGDGNAEMMIVE